MQNIPASIDNNTFRDYINIDIGYTRNTKKLEIQ